jgi:hypothetical protein
MIMVDDIPKDKILFYDIETDSKYAPYANLKMIGYQLGLGEGCHPKIVDLESKPDRERFRDILRDPEMIKVSFNGINYDDIILCRYGFYVEPKGRHDMFLALKTVAPGIQSFSLKYANFVFFGDDHEPESLLEDWLQKHHWKTTDICQADDKILREYCKHDVRQTANLFCLLWEIVQRPEHWDVYRNMELAMAEPLHEMILWAGEWLDPSDIKKKIKKIEEEVVRLNAKVLELSDNRITNPMSNDQVGQYIVQVDEIELELSKAGNYVLDSDELGELVSTGNPIADAVRKIRKIHKVRQFYVNHLKAANFEKNHHTPDHPFRKGDHPTPIDHTNSMSALAHHHLNGDGRVSIPKGYSMSSARTRRFLSSSRFKINFQNQNKLTKLVHLVPHGWLGCWIDSRQIENIVHIHASGDQARREAYEADLNWNEYVWLCNTIFETNYTRKELEEQISQANPSWSIYKQYKMIKLALNFFMGASTFARKARLTFHDASTLFAKVHKACPAITRIVKILAKEYEDNGYIRDVFGHIYGQGGSINSLKNLNQLIIYLIQGCGTGSVPKAMTIANYNTLHSLDSAEAKWSPSIYHKFRKTYSYGVITGTTHDECAFRISLGLPEKEIVRLIKECLYNMEEKFSPLFDGIPLRAQLAVSFTNASKQIEIDHRRSDFEQTLIHEHVRPAKKRYREHVQASLIETKG